MSLNFGLRDGNQVGLSKSTPGLCHISGKIQSRHVNFAQYPRGRDPWNFRLGTYFVWSQSILWTIPKSWRVCDQTTRYVRVALPRDASGVYGHGKLFRWISIEPNHNRGKRNPEYLSWSQYVRFCFITPRAVEICMRDIVAQKGLKSILHPSAIRFKSTGMR